MIDIDKVSHSMTNDNKNVHEQDFTGNLEVGVRFLATNSLLLNSDTNGELTRICAHLWYGNNDGGKLALSIFGATVYCSMWTHGLSSNRFARKNTDSRKQDNNRRNNNCETNRNMECSVGLVLSFTNVS